jgi:hypothetical protein
MNPNNQVGQGRQIPEQVLIHYLSDHEARLNALAAQAVHLGIMLEYTTQQLALVVPEFELDAEDFAEFRERRFTEMKNEALELERVERQALAEKAAQERGDSLVDLSETEEMEGVSEDDE